MNLLLERSDSRKRYTCPNARETGRMGEAGGFGEAVSRVAEFGFARIRVG
jgi:hypothetical protein